MFNFKPTVTTTILLSSLLIQQSAIAYPKASPTAEMNYLKSILINLYGQSHPQMDSYVEAEYKNNSSKMKDALTAGYLICDDIQKANQKGVSGEVLLSQEISNFTETTLTESGIPFTKEHMISFYHNTTNNLCPDLF
jgi:hypothetical protein